MIIGEQKVALPQPHFMDANMLLFSYQCLEGARNSANKSSTTFRYPGTEVCRTQYTSQAVLDLLIYVDFSPCRWGLMYPSVKVTDEKSTKLERLGQSIFP